MGKPNKLPEAVWTGLEDDTSKELNGDDGWVSNLSAWENIKAKHVYEGSDSDEEGIVITTGDEMPAVDEKTDQPSHFTPPPWEHSRASHIYEGSDSDDDKVCVTAANARPPVNKMVGKSSQEPEPQYQFPQPKARVEASDVFADFQSLKLGQLANEQEEFCALGAVKKYPYTFIGAANQQMVAESFFDKNQLLEKNTWDLFYIHEKRSGTGFSNVLLLLPTRQFEQFLKTVNKKLGTNLTIPTGYSGAFEVSFGIPGMPHPRFLGRSTNKDMADRLQLNIPPNTYRLKGEPKDVKPTDRSLEAFRRKIELLQQSQKAKNKFKAEKKKAERLTERKQWSHSLKRVQRYLGLRETRAVPATKMSHLGTDWETPAVVEEIPSAVFKPDEIAPFLFEADVVFICVDVEAYERDNNKITEIGISTLDTRDLAELHPGEGGKNWMEKGGPIRCRHFRISEFRHLNNSEFINGCADRFEFGDSEFVKLDDAPSMVASCFKYPFSNPDESVPAQDNAPKRNIILVGHDVMQDVNYLRKIGYDVYNLSNLMEQVDTASMWRYRTRDPNPRNLGSILADLAITGWNLHNAGNDAAYTLQAMIGIAIKAITDKAKSEEEIEAEKEKRLSAMVEEAKKTAMEREQEWDSNADSDGGNPIKPSAAIVKPVPTPAKPTHAPVKKPSKPVDKNKSPYTSGPWKHEKAVPGTDYWYQDDSAQKGGWAPAGKASNAAPLSWDTSGSNAPVTWETLGRDAQKKREPSSASAKGQSSRVFVPSLSQQNKQSQEAGGWGGQQHDEAGTQAKNRSHTQNQKKAYFPPHLSNPIKQEAEDRNWANTSQVPEEKLARSMAAHHITQPSKGNSGVAGVSWHYGGVANTNQSQHQQEQGNNRTQTISTRAKTPSLQEETESDDGIPAGYSPGRRNQPIGEALNSYRHPGPAPKKGTSQPQVQSGGAYRPTAGNPINRLEDIGRLDQYFVSGGLNRGGRDIVADAGKESFDGAKISGGGKGKDKEESYGNVNDGW